ncbi:MAG TPA: efflux RND transporter periplasmic adaptor subunit [Aestuariivirga sp.]|nr:efflux RND transporter periplasmic adaptor subunit [Aestuariivirga sp.]
MTKHSLPTPEDVQASLGVSKGGRGPVRWRRWLVLALVALAAAALGWWLFGGTASKTTYQTEAVKKSDITVQVTATGTVQPTTKVEVSSELSGVVRKVNVDANSLVKKGEAMAELDTERLSAQIAKARANVAAAEAQAVTAQATVKETERVLTRQQTLRSRGINANQDLDSARAAADRANAGLVAAQANVDVARADLTLQQTDLSKAIIASPVDGVVLSRAVEPGQTVASSLQAPVLFTLAEDLKHMRVEANVDEADIGVVHEGQTANFTVDAYRGQSFPARITKVEFSPQTTDGVVTYTAILEVDNSNLLLRPGMTATAMITVEEVKDTIAVPNGALRYAPPRTERSPGFSLSRLFMPRPPRGFFDKQTAPEAGSGTVYILKNGSPVAVKVKTGATDGKVTAITAGELKEGDEGILSSATSK